MKHDEFMNLNSIKRGQIYRVSKDSRKPYEMCLVIQNDKGNENSPYTIIAEVTNITKKWMPTHVDIKNTNYKHLEALCENVFTIQQSDLGIMVGDCSVEEMQKVDTALALSVGLNQPQKPKEISTCTTEDKKKPRDITDDKQSQEAREYIETIRSTVEALEDSLEKLNNANNNFSTQISEVEALSSLDQKQLETIKKIALGSLDQIVDNNRILLSVAMDITFSKNPCSVKERKGIEINKDFDDAVNQMIEQGKEKNSQQSLKDEKPTRKPLDIGKVMALRAAGWSNQKIADELGRTPGTIAASVCQYRKKLASEKEVKE